jgi:hypothetical protein
MNETEQLAARDLEPGGVLLGPFPPKTGIASRDT